MRKSLLAVAIGAAVTLGACSDASTTSNTENSSTKVESGQEATTMNPFFEASSLLYHAPDFNAIEFKHYEPAFKRGMKEHLEEIQKIADNSAAPTFENTIVAMEKSGQLLDRVSSVFYTLTSSYSNEDIRALQSELAPKMSEHSDNISLNASLFKRIQTLHENSESLDLTNPEKKLLKDTYQRFVRAGALLTDSEKQQVRELNTQLSSLSSDFRDNLLSLTSENLVVVEDKEALAGLSDSQIGSLKKLAEDNGMSGKYAISLTNTTRQALLSQLENRDLRERLWKASSNRGTGNTETDNRPVIQEIVKLRAEKAALLGYESWGHYILADRVAGNPAAAKDILLDLVPTVTAAVEKEAEEIQAVIDSSGEGFDLKPWDWFYYAEKVRQAKYAVDSEEVKQYFELKRVLEDGVFFAMNQLFGISFEERTDIPAYHDDVLVYEVFDRDGESMGLFYGDYFAREGKRGGAWMNSFQVQSDLFDQKPVVLNNLNITKAPEGQPTLLTFDEVSTMFHEMGHAVHGLFSDVKYPSQAGTSVPRDFVEFPSTFEEGWALEPRVIENYAKHHETGKQIPQELLDKVLAARNFNQGFDTLEYLSAALLDLEYHSIEPGTEISDVLDFEASALSKNGVDVEAVPPRYRSTYFAHIFAGGYSAGYYAYMWSEVFAADAFQHMQNNGGLTRDNGDSFRREILSRGGSKAPMKQYVDWRGEEPSVDAVLKARGLADKE